MESNKKLYDLWHERRGVAEEPANTTFRPWHVTVARRLPDLTEKKVLEIGCGRGDFANWLAMKFPTADITAVDFSDKAIMFARERQRAPIKSLRFAVDDAQNLSLACNAFDYVISCEVLEHLPHPEKMAKQIHRVLKPGGEFVLTTENYFNAMVLSWIVSWLRKVPYDSGSGVQPHESFFLYWRVKSILERAGLQVRHMESNHFQWLLLPRCAPHALCTEDFRNPFLKRLFRPFGRHFTFEGTRA